VSVGLDRAQARHSTQNALNSQSKIDLCVFCDLCVDRRGYAAFCISEA